MLSKAKDEVVEKVRYPDSIVITLQSTPDAELLDMRYPS
jgi:hypothetical protein